jgi:hypothetical protein
LKETSLYGSLYMVGFLIIIHRLTSKNWWGQHNTTPTPRVYVGYDLTLYFIKKYRFVNAKKYIGLYYGKTGTYILGFCHKVGLQIDLLVL